MLLLFDRLWRIIKARAPVGANNADNDKMMMMVMINNEIGFPDSNNRTMVQAEQSEFAPRESLARFVSTKMMIGGFKIRVSEGQWDVRPPGYNI